MSTPRGLGSHALLIALFLASGCGGEPSFTLGTERLEEGQQVRVTQSLESRITGTVTPPDGPPQPLGAEQATEYAATLTVLDVASSGGAATVSVHFDHATTRLSVASGGLDQPETDLPLAGRTFTVELAEEVSVRGVDGVELDPALEATVAGAARMLADHSRGQLRACIPDEPLPLGTAIDLTACRAAIFAGAGYEVTASSLVLDSVGPHEGRSAGAFALAMALKGSGAGQPDVDLTGQMVLDAATGQVLRMAVAGPMTLAPPPGPARIEGSGTLSMEQTLGFAPPPGG